MKKKMFVSLSLLLLVGGLTAGIEQNFKSEHFDVEQLSNGVYALIHRPGGQAICNAGIIDLGNEVLVFDTFLSTIAANDLKKAVRELTGKPVRWVVNSHAHNDHIRGNQVFLPGASIISTLGTREYILEHGMEEADDEQTYAPGMLKEYKEKLMQADNDEEREVVKMWLGYFEAMVEGYPGLKIITPDVIFQDTLMIIGSDRTVLLIEFSEGHMESDLVLYLPEEKILFTGDLVFIEMHPYLADGDVGGLKRIMGDLSGLSINQLVPGHGNVGGYEHLKPMTDYVEMLETLVLEMIQDGRTPEEVTVSDIPKPFSHWAFPNFFKYNLSYIYGLYNK